MEEQDRRIDAALVSAWLAGERDAFESLFQRWNPKLVRYAARMLNDPDEAKDACQDGWTDILRTLESLNDRSLFRIWAFRIVTRKCHRRLRRRYRHRTATPVLEMDAELAEHDAGDIADIDTRIDAQAVVRALRCLAGPQLAAMELFYIEDLSVAEIAAILGVPSGTVKTRLLHERAHVRKFIMGGTK